MSRYELVFAESADRDLSELLSQPDLAADARQRVDRSLEVLEEFPLSGRALEGRWRGYRLLIGPYGWVVFVYEIVDEQTVAIVTVQDARTSTSPTNF